MGIMATSSSILEIPKGNKQMRLITPYSDEEMIYDAEEHQYKLTLKYVKDKLGINLADHLNTAASDDPQVVAEYKLNQISNEVYSYIYAQNSNNEMQEFYAAKLEATRTIIKKAMLEQLSYELVSGSLSMFSGVNIKTGQIMDKKKLSEAVIGFRTKQELDRFIPELGIALTYQGQLVTPINFKFREDY